MLLRAFSVFILVVVLIYFRPWLNSKSQAERAHGILLPESAFNINTVGDWRKGFMDRGATTVLTLEAREMAGFISNLSDERIRIGGGPPGNAVYHIGLDIPWKAGQEPVEAFTVASPVGDWLSVEVYWLTDDISAIRLYTDWN